MKAIPLLSIRIFNRHTGEVQYRDAHWLLRMRKSDFGHLKTTPQCALMKLCAGEVLETDHEWWRKAQEHDEQLQRSA